MNYGFDPLNEQERPSLQEQDEPDRYSIQLYHFLAAQTEIQGKKMLEVGSGRGGGASYIARYLKPAEITGMDIADNAVAFANKRHHAPNLNYVTGNAEQIPFPDNHFDVVINVESSHAYGSVEKFFTEVARILKPGGIFLITDMRDPNNIGKFEQKLFSSGLTKVSQAIINDNIEKAIENEDDLKRARIRAAVPSQYVKFFEEFSGVKGSQIQKDIQDHRLIYFWYVMKK
jgi:ubiquinone/menaquinone biosynthesis C-methylase UbiE